MTTASGLHSLGALAQQHLRAPLIGRGPELRELEEALGRAISTRQPRAVTVVGAPGIGKTRLVHEFLQRVRERERRVRTYRGACRDKGPTFGVVQRILRARFGIIEGADPEQTRAQFRDMVTEVLGDRRVTEFLHFLGAFLDLKFPESPFIRAVEEDPAQFMRISRAVLRRFFEADAQRHPLVLTFEDLHWAHDDAVELVRYLVETMADAPILMLLVTRPELFARHPDFTKAGGERHTRIELGPLGHDDTARLVGHLLAPLGEPPDELVEAAVDMAGGSPYLCEQVIRVFHDAGVLFEKAEGGWDVDLGRLDQAQLPLSVDDAIAARLSALAPRERELLEMASVMGGVFWLGALVALSRIDRPTPELWGGVESEAAHIRDALGSLAERDYVLELPDSSIPGEIEYAFKHNLERETLHRLASQAALRRFHLVVAEWLEFRLAERAEEQCELLAQHFEAGGALRKAGQYYLAAGDRARLRYGNLKAIEYYEKGLRLLGDEDVPARIDALHALGDVLQLAGRNEEALAAFRSMLEIAYRLDLKAKGGAAHNRIGRLYRAIGHLDEAMRHLGTGHALFDAAGDRRGVAASLDDVGKVHWMRGNYEAAERFMKQALTIRQELGDARGIALSQNNLGLVYQDSGRFAEAQAAFGEALRIRREIDDKPGIAQTLNNLGTIHQDAGDHERAVDLYRDALEVAREVGDRMRQAVILTNIGESHYRMNRPAEAIRTLKQAEELSSTLGDRILEGEILRGLAKAHMLVHDVSTARDYVQRAIALFEQARGRPFLGVALRTQGEIYAAAGWGGENHARARESFERSIQVFEELGNEIELAQSLEKYAEFLEQTPGAGTDPVVAHEIMTHRARADEIRRRMAEVDVESAGLPPLEGEATSPGTTHDTAVGPPPAPPADDDRTLP
ncbi:MAG: tetratricopeptide repeat protein [Myxococcota bacterium]|nr:tetratricopeptide repeat protein [Myxococcota bacterium]